ncbi:peptidylprolyl isomerase [Devosia rhodophyticola]|uniref:Peptidyl-prolyl cis-trans isomerase n=1 Tax=Devosia rhodophyticola TaxID=3026423 RepID=A0ABY7YY61_9HYPH|nr:peptidylprolyl isomerase [Devosia rhodophyticola]WDR05730.1 peptidylprolyl isomerase [Devosia rhodophyticola]
MNIFSSSRRSFIATVAFAGAAVVASLFPGAALAQTPAGTPHMMLQLESGTVDIELEPSLAPNHVAQIVTLAEQGFYDGIVFHRVIEGFMAQTGDPTGTGMGGSDLPDINAEFTSEPFVRGTVGMARSQDPNSANSQFFIMFADGSFLNGQYTVFGKVVSGMEFVDRLKKGSQEQNGTVANPDKIVKATIEYRE